MAAQGCIVLAVLLAVKSSDSAMSITITGPRMNTSFEFSTLFGNPSTNLPFASIAGAVYYFPNVSACSPFPPPTYALLTTNTSFVIVENYSQCILEKVNFARQAGYEVLLTYVENDTNSTITSAVAATGYPVVVLPQYVANMIMKNGTVLSEDDPTSVILAISDIVVKIVIIGTIALAITIFFIFACCVCPLLVCRCLSERTNNVRVYQPFQRFEEERRHGPGYQQRAENIHHQLAEVEHSLGPQVPLGRNRTKKLPTRLFKKGQEHDETCSICMEDFVNRVRVKVLPCQHIFHPICIDGWLSDHSSVCPMCKAVVQNPTGAGGNRINNNMYGAVSGVGE